MASKLSTAGVGQGFRRFIAALKKPISTGIFDGGPTIGKRELGFQK